MCAVKVQYIQYIQLNKVQYIYEGSMWVSKYPLTLRNIFPYINLYSIYENL